MSKDLRREVNKLLEEYVEDVQDILDDNAQYVAKETAKEIKNNAPRKTGEYATGITSKLTTKGRNGKTFTVYNKNKPQLTHLLEHGHAKVNGGRVSGTPHWAPAEETAIKEYEDRILRAIE